MTEQQLANDCAQAMWQQDTASQSQGMQLKSVSPGTAILEMPVAAHMLNGHKTCHGGFIFTLADSAFAFACNTYNKTTVAAAADISFVSPAYEGDMLTATASETWKKGRSGLYDVTVTNQNNEPVAFFRGKSRTISKTGPLDAPHAK